MTELDMTCNMSKDGMLSIKGIIFEDPFYTRWFEKYFSSVIRYFFDLMGINSMAQFIAHWIEYKEDFEHCVMGSVISYMMGAGD